MDWETEFWQLMVDQDTESALEMLDEPALMISAHGSMKFDHEGYRKMADQRSMILTSFEFSDMDVVFPEREGTPFTQQSVNKSTNGELCATTMISTVHETRRSDI